MEGPPADVEVAGPNAYKLTEERRKPDGNVEKSTEVLYLDGRENNIGKGQVRVTKRIASDHIHDVVKENGKEVAVFDASVSPDGRELTVLYKDIRPGKEFEARRVYERE